MPLPMTLRVPLSDERSYQQEFLTTLLRWALILVPALVLVYFVAFVRDPSLAKLMTIGEMLLALAAVLWSLRRVQLGKTVWPARALILLLLGVELLYMLCAPEQIRSTQGAVIGVMVLLATFLDRLQLALRWAAVGAAVYLVGIFAPPSLRLPSLDMGPLAGPLTHFVVVVQLVLVATLVQNMTRHLRESLARSEAARQELQHSNARLERQKTELEATKAALSTLAESLERSNRELQSFASVVSHDLRAPLRALTNYSRFLQEDLAGKLDATDAEYLAGIADSARHMDALVVGLLEYSRIGRIQVAPEKVELGPLLEQVAAALDLGKRAELVVPRDLPTVWARPTRLAQIFTSLLDNAAKFRRPGARPSVAIEWADRGDAWELGVRDDGIGIAHQHFEKIFGLFQRLHARDEYEGTGIGLALVKKAVEEHGGQVWVDSTPGRGSVFRFSLPKAA